mgnify:CR=1 FL=1
MKKPFLERYGGQSTEELLALESQYRVDSLVLAFEAALEDKDAGGLSEEETYVLAVEGLEREVNNGGYRQFFGNGSNRYVTVIEAALRAIGCPVTADITRDAIEALGLEELSAEAVEAATVAPEDDVDDALATCDDSYYDSGEPIADRLFAWIRLHHDRIRVGPQR